MLPRSMLRTTASLAGPTATRPHVMITRGFHGRTTASRPTGRSGGIIQTGTRPESRILGRHDLVFGPGSRIRDLWTFAEFRENVSPLTTGLKYLLLGFSLVTGTVVAFSLPNALAPIQADTFQASTALQQAIDRTINSHPLTLSMRSNSSYHEARPHLLYPSAFRESSLTAGTLQGYAKFEVPPYMWISPEEKKLVSIFYLGNALCTPPDQIHGGLLATILDEGLARCAFESLPNRICVTASLKVDYLKPLEAERYVTMKCWTVKTEGRKCWVEGVIEDVESGDVVAKAEALMVQPRGKLLGWLGRRLSEVISPKRELKEGKGYESL